MAVNFGLKQMESHTILSVNGRLINESSNKFGKKLRQFCQAPGKNVVIDITGVNFIDSYSISLLIEHHSKLKAEGRQLILLFDNDDKNSFVNRVFDVTGLNTIFHIHNSLDALDGPYS